MVVIAIIGILAAIAVPAYMNYLVRAQIAETLSLNGFKSAVVEYHGVHGAFPLSNASIGFPDETKITGNYVISVGIKSTGASDSPMVIVAEMGNNASGAINDGFITLTPIATSGSIYWNCIGANISTSYLPTTCEAFI